MQLNYNENKSFAEYATVSSSRFEAGRQKEKAILFKVQAFLRGLTDVGETEPSLVYLKSNTFFSCVLEGLTST